MPPDDRVPEAAATWQRKGVCCVPHIIDRAAS